MRHRYLRVATTGLQEGREFARAWPNAEIYLLFKHQGRHKGDNPKPAIARTPNAQKWASRFICCGTYVYVFTFLVFSHTHTPETRAYAQSYSADPRRQETGIRHATRLPL